MIKIFRSLKQRLLKEKKLKQYLLTAVGEISLVVIGILIALAINNYSDQKKAKAQSEVQLLEMVEDLERDIKYLDKMLPILEQQLEVEEYVSSKLGRKSISLDTLQSYASEVNWIFNVNDRAFQNIQNSSVVKLSGYSTLYSPIAQYYITTMGRIIQNNDLERQSQVNPGKYQNWLKQHITVAARKYMDYSGFSVELKPSLVANISQQEIINQLALPQTHNEVIDKYTRHNYHYLALTVCQKKAQKLKKIIEKALPNE